VKLRVFDSADAVAGAAADSVAAAVAARPAAVLALPTGRTPIPLYDALASRHEKGAIDFSGARGFNLDELALPPGDPRTFRSYMERHAWGRTGLKRERCAIPDGVAPDLEAECRRYEAAIEEAGGIDLAILGVGADGHVAYNMPGPVTFATHVTRLPDGLASSLGVPPEDWPLRALTMGIGTIRGARALLVLATGAAKAAAVRALVRGPEDLEWPCSFLYKHPDLEVLVDREAASGLAISEQGRGVRGPARGPDGGGRPRG
jgi:glucosamine-6-phosphate deaminase